MEGDKASFLYPAKVYHARPGLKILRVGEHLEGSGEATSAVIDSGVAWMCDTMAGRLNNYRVRCLGDCLRRTSGLF